MFNHSEYGAVQEHILSALDDWGSNGLRQGDFLMAVLANDLAEAACRADNTNRYVLREIVQYVFNELPSACHGSPAKVQLWEKHQQDYRDLIVEREVQKAAKVMLEAAGQEETGG